MVAVSDVEPQWEIKLHVNKGSYAAGSNNLPRT